jgi:geranylgeranyl diphosphate synthase type II
LVHDDIIDRDEVRYGVPNLTGAYKVHYSHHGPQAAQRQHFAQSAALLGGDLLISGAYAIMATAPLPPSQIVLAQQQLAQSMFEVVGGELLDTEASFSDWGAIPAETIARYKTASYSFVGPLLTGARLADTPSVSLRHLQRYAECVGVAYQLADDLLGMFGDPARTGKSATGDIREGKRTYLIEQFLARASATDKAFFLAHYGQADVTDQAVAQIKQLLISSGAGHATRQAIAGYTADALAALEELSLPAEATAALADLAQALTDRSK